MAIYTPNSWGRTRRPKQLYEHLPKADKQGASFVEIVTSGVLNANLNDSNAGRNGYSTENQKYLHVFVKHDADAQKTVEIWGYNYAFGEWAPIFLPLGNATYTQATVVSSGTAGIGRHYIFEINGIDRVAFCSADAPARVRAACSTF